ncbi:MAG TPA: hypothetical protein VE988_05640, partial [Gemmataceae bacterium]|nr:hypothetical protein [Gemmataceae bacterium]
MAKMKIDGKKIKEIFTSRYEILAVGIAAVLVVVCLVWGVSILMGASSPVDDMMKTKAELEAKSKQNPPAGKITKDKLDIGWPAVTKGQAKLLLRDWYETGAGDSSGRLNPRIL